MLPELFPFVFPFTVVQLLNEIDSFIELIVFEIDLFGLSSCSYLYVCVFYHIY